MQRNRITAQFHWRIQKVRFARCGVRGAYSPKKFRLRLKARRILLSCASLNILKQTCLSCASLNILKQTCLHKSCSDFFIFQEMCKFLPISVTAGGAFAHNAPPGSASAQFYSPFSMVGVNYFLQCLPNSSLTQETWCCSGVSSGDRAESDQWSPGANSGRKWQSAGGGGGEASGSRDPAFRHPVPTGPPPFYPCHANGHHCPLSPLYLHLIRRWRLKSGKWRGGPTQTPVTWKETIESLERINSIREGRKFWLIRLHE